MSFVFAYAIIRFSHDAAHINGNDLLQVCANLPQTLNFMGLEFPLQGDLDGSPLHVTLFGGGGEIIGINIISICYHYSQMLWVID